MVLLIDNYDSFVYNLARYFEELGEETVVVRNDAIDARGALALRPDHVVLSPGPCTPREAGICVDLVRRGLGHVPILGVCLGHQCLGAALGAAGAITQGLLRNPMAEPGVLGISMGAAAVTVLGFSLGLDDAGVWVTPALAALGAASVLLVLFALVGPATGLGTLLLSGIALGALCSALTTLMLAFDAERWDLGHKIVFWLMGSFEGRSWNHLLWAVE